MNMRIDVTEVLLDPDFADLDMTYTRLTETVGSNGRTVLAGSPLPLVGVVTNDKGDQLFRTEDGTRVPSTIVVHTTTTLRVGGAGFEADLVTWNGQTYVVSNLADYSTYGAGFTVAICTLQTIAG